MSDLGFIFKNRKRVRALFRGESLSPAFRERMMLAVTRVNECRYCARFHAKAALAEGISREEVDAILGGAFKDCPSDQLVGVLYAEHWAEMSGVPGCGGLRQTHRRVWAKHGERYRRRSAGCPDRQPYG